MANVTKPVFKERYGNFIGGKFVAPVKGQYFDNVSPVDGQVFTQAARSTQEDIDLALDAAHEAFPAWSTSSATERSNALLKIAQVMEDNFEYLATLETIDNGKPIRESRAADIPYCIDHFRYFAGIIRADEGSISEHDKNTVSIVLHEPIGVVGEIIPWNFPMLMLAWKIAPALAAGCTAVVKPAEQTPTSVIALMELIGDILPPGVLNIVTGFGAEAGAALATSKRIAKLSFTGSTETGRKVLHNAAENIIPVTMELGGKSPNIFFPSVADKDDDFYSKAIEGALMFALNQGEICTAPSRILVHEDIADDFIARMQERLSAIKTGNPLDPETMIGSQVSKPQYEKILNYINIGKEEGALVLAGGDAGNYGGEISEGYYIQPTVLKGTNDMRVFQEEIFGPVLAVTTFKDEDEALAIANDTIYGLGSGVWSRDAHQLHKFSRGIEAGRVWVNCYHLYPSHASFGGYKKSGIGRETHMMMLNSYRHTKNILTSYNKNKLGFF